LRWWATQSSQSTNGVTINSIHREIYLFWMIWSNLRSRWLNLGDNDSYHLWAVLHHKWYEPSYCLQLMATNRTMNQLTWSDGEEWQWGWKETWPRNSRTRTMKWGHENK
jgi:hypothetical protein